MKIAVGPLLYYWPRERVLAFYEELAASCADVVYLGEVVCTRRHELAFEDWLEIGGRLAAAGKEVVLSAPALTESEGDLKILRRLAANGAFRVEANDWGAVRLLAGREGWVAGPHLNVYNPDTLSIVHEAGARRWVAPFEATQVLVAGVLAARPAGVEAEVFAHGRVPLAHSARCFTARRFNLQKESCAYRCIDFPDGMALDTRDGEPFLVANGVQTQSAAVYSLAGQVGALRALGVGAVRVSPQAHGTRQALDAWRAALDGAAPEATRAALEALCAPARLADGFWRGRPGMEAA